jgi:phenylalanyl-tRNA synthetase beta chain
MKVSEHWLRQWVNPAVSTTELAAQLTMAGLEVDRVETAAPPFAHVVAGRVIGLIQHPDADRLRVATVDVGGVEPLQIVCGAPNVAVGMCAPTAMIGAVLPGGLTIKKSKLRGIESQGMLCSAKELGLAETSNGLLPLPATVGPVRSVRELLHLDDALIEIELTPNRGDCLGMEGIAREVATLNRCEFRPVPADPVTPTLDATFAVTLLDPCRLPALCGSGDSRGESGGGNAVVDEGTAAPRRPAQSGAAGGRDQLCDAGTRPADARFRSEPADGRD